jgi:hypothetical protein
VFVFSSSLNNATDFTDFHQNNYIVNVVPLDVYHLLQETPAASWLDNLTRWRKQPHYFSNLSNAVRKAALFHWGGIWVRSLMALCACTCAWQHIVYNLKQI